MPLPLRAMPRRLRVMPPPAYAAFLLACRYAIAIYATPASEAQRVTLITDAMLRLLIDITLYASFRRLRAMVFSTPPLAAYLIVIDAYDTLRFCLRCLLYAFATVFMIRHMPITMLMPCRRRFSPAMLFTLLLLLPRFRHAAFDAVISVMFMLDVFCRRYCYRLMPRRDTYERVFRA